MLGNGVKRKLDEDEDGLEEDRRPLAVGGISQASYTLQRQTVLNMSLMKLYGPRMGADLGLQRRVLINNIIRRIHDDFRQEGGVGALFFSAAPPDAAAAATREDESYRQPPPPPSSFSILSSSLSGLTPLDSCLTPASLLEEDLPMFFTLPPSSSTQHHHLHHSLRPPPPSQPTPSPKDSFSSALEEIEELCPSSSSSSSSSPPSPPPARVLLDVVMKEDGRGFQEVESRLEKPPSPPLARPPPLPPSPSSPGSFLTDFALDDVLFTDIDTSMYDLGPCPPPSGAPSSKMSPAVMADDLVRSMSGYSAAGAGTQNQPFKMDLAELDHIMEVLVGS
ncbi:SERTA domain-containing protein 2-like [Siniperca chuatsi]|uniref:SERTA domain-containing protein 2-like n=1 Tax=Siniperca chuatsi TaxID=119488 RepID=UPI001CE08E92|nr:SERTA domain-containing protein 2-like [Siniperca chuatsi]